ncbi:MAG TPA: GlsB/YeaQ/YmgE family stress response membrane protein [Acidimicrobiales bacterium]
MLDPTSCSQRHHRCLDGSGTVIGFIIMLIVIGIIAGYVARLLVPGRDPMSFVQTAILGIVGSFIGGFLGYLLFGHDIDDGALQASGIIGSIIGAVIALLIYNATARRGMGRRI